MILGVFFDNWALQLFGTAKALGIHKHLVCPIFFCCWVVNLGFCIFLAFYLKWDFQGIWVAIVISQVTLAIFAQMIIDMADWDTAIEKCLQTNDEEDDDDAFNEV